MWTNGRTIHRRIHYNRRSPRRQRRRRRPHPPRGPLLHLNFHILLLQSPVLKDLLRGLLPGIQDLRLEPRLGVVVQETFLPVWSRGLEVAVVLDTFAADVALQVSAGTGHFVAAVDFNEWSGAVVAFLYEGCGHGFFDDVLCGEFVFFFVF